MGEGHKSDSFLTKGGRLRNRWKGRTDRRGKVIVSKNIGEEGCSCGKTNQGKDANGIKKENRTRHRKAASGSQ